MKESKRKRGILHTLPLPETQSKRPSVPTPSKRRVNNRAHPERKPQQMAVVNALHETTLALMSRLELSDFVRSLVSRAAALMDVAHGYVALVEPDQSALVTRYGLGAFNRHIGDRLAMGQDAAGSVWQTGQPIVIDDYQTYSERITSPDFDMLRAWVGIPLRSDTQVIGVIGLARTIEGQTFSAEELNILSQFAELASVALENARLHTLAQQELAEHAHAEEELSKQNAYLEALHETNLALISRLNLNDLLEGIVSRAGVLMGTEHGYVFLLTPDGTEMQQQVGVGLYTSHTGVRIQPGIGIVGKVWQSGEPLVVDNYHTWSGRTVTVAPETRRTVMAIPLTSGTQVVGAIGLAYVEEERTFGKREIDLLSRFAQLASIALENARLYTMAQQELAERQRVEEEVRRDREELETRVEERTAELQESEERYRTILDQIYDGYYEVDLAGASTFMNDGTRRIFGLTKDATKLKPFREYADEMDSKRVYQAYNQVYRTGQPIVGIDYKVHRRDGTTCYVESSCALIRDKNGKPIGFRGISRDVTERKQAEERLRQQKEYLAALHDITLGFISRLDLNELLQTIVTRAGALLGTSHGYVYLLTPDQSEMQKQMGVGIYRNAFQIAGRAPG